MANCCIFPNHVKGSSQGGGEAQFAAQTMPAVSSQSSRLTGNNEGDEQSEQLYDASDDYYNVLGLNRNANDEEVKRAYHKMALKWHPDKNAHRREVAEQQFKLVSEAYQILSDRAKRLNYDSYVMRDSRRQFADMPFETVVLGHSEPNLFPSFSFSTHSNGAFTVYHSQTYVHCAGVGSAASYSCSMGYSVFNNRIPTKSSSSSFCVYGEGCCSSCPPPPPPPPPQRQWCPVCEDYSPMYDQQPSVANNEADVGPIPKYRNKYRCDETCFHLNRNRHATQSARDNALYQSTRETEI